MKTGLFRSSCFRVVEGPWPGKIFKLGFRVLKKSRVLEAAAKLPENRSVRPELFLKSESPENKISLFKMNEVLPAVWPGQFTDLKTTLLFKLKEPCFLKVCKLFEFSLKSKPISFDAFL